MEPIWRRAMSKSRPHPRHKTRCPTDQPSLSRRAELPLALYIPRALELFAASLFYFIGKSSHLLRCVNSDYLATCNVLFRLFNRSHKLKPSAFALFPKRQRLAYRVLFAAKPPRFNRLADKCLLIRAQSNVHVLQPRSAILPF